MQPYIFIITVFDTIHKNHPLFHHILNINSYLKIDNSFMFRIVHINYYFLLQVDQLRSIQYKQIVMSTNYV